MSIRLEQPVSAVAPGQAAVVYDATQPERVLGGGWIQGGHMWADAPSSSASDGARPGGAA